MSLRRYAKKVDATQKAIVEALRQVGVQVWVISQPCDLLTLYRKRWLPLECKPEDPKNRNRKDQAGQKEFLEATGTPVVKTVLEAIEAVTKHGATV